MSSRGGLCPGGIHRGTDGQGWLLLYTDGLMETRDRNGELFDLAALGRQAEAPNLEHTGPAARRRHQPRRRDRQRRRRGPGRQHRRAAHACSFPSTDRLTASGRTSSGSLQVEEATAEEKGKVASRPAQ